MGFVLNCTLDNMEYRGTRSGVGRESKKPWMMLVLEDSEAQQIQVSVPGDMQQDVASLGLRKGDLLLVAVRAVAARATSQNQDNSYIQLAALPELYEDEEQ